MFEAVACFKYLHQYLNVLETGFLLISNWDKLNRFLAELMWFSILQIFAKDNFVEILSNVKILILKHVELSKNVSQQLTKCIFVHRLSEKSKLRTTVNLRCLNSNSHEVLFFVQKKMLQTFFSETKKHKISISRSLRFECNTNNNNNSNSYNNITTIAVSSKIS